jgi:hypothetical protein
MPIPPCTYGARQIKVHELLLTRTVVSATISELFRRHPAMFEIRSRIGVSRLARGGNWRGCAIALVLLALVTASCAQEASQTSKPPESPSVNAQLPVNWLYGAYIPKNAPLVALNGQERFKLYVRQTYTTPGIYIKTGFFAVHDQATNSPSAWGDGFSGFAERIGSNQAVNIIQNSFTSLGQGIVGWEPRYDRCRCTGGWLRFRHAFIRNFITYDHSEQSVRPNIMPFAAAFGAGAIGATWNPNNPTIQVKGYQSVITQAWVGVVINSIGEFAPDLKKRFSKHKD